MNDKEMERMLSEIYASGSWYMFPKCFLAIMVPREAILMAYLINISNMERSKRGEEGIGSDKGDGWFMCKRDRIYRSLFIKVKTVTDLFASLKNKGFLETKWMGQPGKLWLKINIMEIHRRAAEVVQRMESAYNEGDDFTDCMDDYLAHERV